MIMMFLRYEIAFLTFLRRLFLYFCRNAFTLESKFLREILLRPSGTRKLLFDICCLVFLVSLWLISIVGLLSLFWQPVCNDDNHGQNFFSFLNLKSLICAE